MLKELAPTTQMIAALESCSGGPVDVSNIAIFECIALNTSPISKRGSIFEGATPGKGMLADMAAYVQSGNFVKLHTLHEQGYELPIGNVFLAELKGEDLRALFYIGRDTEQGLNLIAKLNNSTIDEVSCGVQPAHLRCSECGWDFFGPDADLMNLWDRTCANDHTIGVNGVHGKMEGLDRWLELSLVSIGAAKGAKIVGRTKSLLGAEEYQRLAASGLDPEITTLFASAGRVIPDNHEEEATMADPNVPSQEAGFALVASLTTDKVTAELALATANATISSVTEANLALTAQVAELTASIAAAQEGLALKEAHNKVVSFLSEQTKAAMIASGVTAPQVPESIDDMLATLEATKLKLHNLPSGQQMEGSAGASASSHKNAALAAFKICK